MDETPQWQKFSAFVTSRGHGPFADYSSLHKWSVNDSGAFWRELISFLKLDVEGSAERSWSSASGKQDFEQYGWFPDLKLNFAKVLLERGSNLQDLAIEAWHESGSVRKISYGELKSDVSKLQQFFKQDLNLRPSDVVAAYMPNIPETVVAMLAASSLGATFTSTSCDFGLSGVVDRFGQSRPSVLIMATHYTYGGKLIDLTSRVAEIAAAVPSIKKIIIVDFLKQLTLEQKASLKNRPEVVFYDDVMMNAAIALEYVALPFSHPLYIMYSSGTTGRPKCMVHSAGGTILQHMKEHVLQLDFRPQEKTFFFTTCGWMMWNWLVSALANRTTIVLYEGSPSNPSCNHFMKLVGKMQVHHWGTSPKFLRALEMEGVAREFKEFFQSWRSVLSSGAPLLKDQYTFISEYLSSKASIVSFSGGTDIISCFLIGARGLPIHAGELQVPGLGMDVAALDAQGQRIWDKEGELACLRPFVSMPTHFLGDTDRSLYRKAYFEHGQSRPGAMEIWYHGDYIRFNSQTGGSEIFGRSDATLNPGGVRIGTAEIYGQTEKITEIIDSICVAKQTKDGDVDVWLLVKLKSGIVLDKALKDKIKTLIRSQTTPRHVPKQIFAVSDIPYTRSGKKVELAVAKIINGKEINNLEAIANPECLAEYRSYASHN
jgi:acetoacetyl-CoA synthetase